MSRVQCELVAVVSMQMQMLIGTKSATSTDQNLPIVLMVNVLSASAYRVIILESEIIPTSSGFDHGRIQSAVFVGDVEQSGLPFLSAALGPGKNFQRDCLPVVYALRRSHGCLPALP
jgi:hypothetical protein